jgi:Uma2 family endonuclease
MATISRILTYEEWLQLPTVEDGRDEVVNGELRFMPPNHYPHAEIIRRLFLALSDHVDRNQVIILNSVFGLLISRDPLTCRSPDLAVYRRENIVINDGLYCSAPELIVEVISPSETKRRKEEKMRDYAAMGVAEAWLISPEAQSVEVHLLHQNKFSRTAILVDGELHPQRFPAVSLTLASLWPE